MDFSCLQESYKRAAEAGTPSIVLVTDKVECHADGCDGHLTEVSGSDGHHLFIVLSGDELSPGS
jgi:hypothetical protein